MSTCPYGIWDAPVLLSDMLREDLLVIGLRSRSKGEVLGELLDIGVQNGALDARHRQGALDALLLREQGKSTGLAHGIAIPHAAVSFLDRPLCVLGTSTSGVEFECLDGTPARVFILLLVPQNSLQSHVRTLAGIARILNSAELRAGIVGASSPATVLHLIREAEGWEE